MLFCRVILQVLNNDLSIDIRKINKIIKRLIEKAGIDKVTHFFAGATIALFSLL